MILREKKIPRNRRSTDKMKGRNGILFSHFSPYVLVTYSLPSPARAFTPSSPLKQGKKSNYFGSKLVYSRDAHTQMKGAKKAEEGKAPARGSGNITGARYPTTQPPTRK